MRQHLLWFFRSSLCLIASYCIFWSVQHVTVKPLEEFTARMFAVMGTNMGWAYQSEGDVHSVYVPLTARSRHPQLYVDIVAPCTYLSLFLGLLPWVCSRRWRVSLVGVLLVTIVTLIANCTRFFAWVELMRLGWLGEEEQKLWPGNAVTLIAYAIFILFHLRFIDPLPKSRPAVPSIATGAAALT